MNINLKTNNMINLIKPTATSFKNKILPIFKGYYGSDFEEEINNRIENEANEENKDLDINYGPIYKDLSEQIYEQIINELIHYKIINKANYVCLDSPKYYNFSNDQIIFDFDLLPENILQISKLIYENKDYVKEELKLRFTSYDGFFSFYSNDFNLWEQETNNFTCFDSDKIHFSSLLDILLSLYIDESSLVVDYDIIYSNIN